MKPKQPITTRPTRLDDWASIWPFVRRIVAAGETFAWDPALSEAEARARWLLDPPGHTFSAVDESGRVIGVASVYPNHEGNGSHVASANFMVDPNHEGRGAGRALGERVLKQARNDGYSAIQFNAVVETNTRAVRLWQSLGFEILATVPEAFSHPNAGHVGLHIMYRRV